MEHAQTVGAVFIAIVAVVSGIVMLIKAAISVVKALQASMQATIDANSKPTEELSYAVKELNLTLKSIQEDAKENKELNLKQHDRIFENMREHDKAIGKIHIRLTKLETEHNNNHE